MGAKDLARQWEKPNNNLLSSKQISIRLPVHVAGALEAIVEMFPNRNRSEIICDLLAAALEDFEKSLVRQGDLIGADENTGDPIYEDIGRTQEFRKLRDKHIALIQKGDQT